MVRGVGDGEGRWTGALVMGRGGGQGLQSEDGARRSGTGAHKSSARSGRRTLGARGG